MKRYEGLFILNTAGQDEGLKEVIDKITAEIAAHGGKVEAVQKMDRYDFARVRNKKYKSGFYVNVIFECEPAVVNQLRTRFSMNESIFRVMFTLAPAARAAK